MEVDPCRPYRKMISPRRRRFRRVLLLWNPFSARRGCAGGPPATRLREGESSAGDARELHGRSRLQSSPDVRRGDSGKYSVRPSRPQFAQQGWRETVLLADNRRETGAPRRGRNAAGGTTRIAVLVALIFREEKRNIASGRSMAHNRRPNRTVVRYSI